MGCGCRNRTPDLSRNPPQIPFAQRPVVPVQTPASTARVESTITSNNNRIQALNLSPQAIENKVMNPERLRIERLRREAVKNALGKV